MNDANDGFGWVPRLMRTRIVRHPARTVGKCCACSVAFGGTVEQAASVEQVLRAHESICPGGERDGELVLPFQPDAAEETMSFVSSAAR